MVELVGDPEITLRAPQKMMTIVSASQFVYTSNTVQSEQSSLGKTYICCPSARQGVRRTLDCEISGVLSSILLLPPLHLLTYCAPTPIISLAA